MTKMNQDKRRLWVSLYSGV